MSADPAAATVHTALWRRLADDIIGTIQDGTHGLGTRLPSEAELAREFQTSRPTVVQAMRFLTETGWVRRRQGVGTFVAATIGASEPATVQIRSLSNAPMPSLSVADTDTDVRLVAVSDGTVIADVHVWQSAAAPIPAGHLTNWALLTRALSPRSSRARTSIAVTADRLNLIVTTHGWDPFTSDASTVTLRLLASRFTVDVGCRIGDGGEKDWD